MARELTDAQTVLLIVLKGSRGSGFSMQSTAGSDSTAIPGLLREVARQIETGEET